MAETIPTIERESDFKKTETGWQERWAAEISAARKAHENFRTQGVKVVDRYLMDKEKDEVKKISDLNLGLFHSNTKTVRSLLYGRLPVIDVSREHADPNDDTARVAGEMLERVLNQDVKRYSQSYPAALRHCLDDRLQPGLGQVWLRYEFSGDEETGITSENVAVDYVSWDDFEWSPCKVYGQKRWVARKVRMNMDQAEKRFGEEKADRMTFASKSPTHHEATNDDDQAFDAWKRAEVWEIWAEEYKRVFWYCEGAKEILDIREDPLELEGFYPCPEPLMANVTTRACVPKSDYKMAEDLYVEINHVEWRISNLTESIKLVGVYDAAAGDGVQRMLKEGLEGDLIPVDTMAQFADRGGMKGAIEWLPIDMVSEVVMRLTERRDDLIGLLQQITGMNDVMRGGGATQGGAAVSATQNALEAKFASVRMQALQDEFAIFATNIMQIKAEIISRHFQPNTIIQQSNISYTADEQHAQEGVKLIKDGAEMAWRVKVRAESIAMVDYASLRQERTEYIQGLSVFMQSSVPLIQAMPETLPFLLEMLKWGMAGFKGSDDIEGVLDQAIDVAQKAAQQKAQGGGQKEKDAGVQKEEIKQQGDRQKEQAQLALVQTKAQSDMQEEDQRHQNRLEEIEHETAQTLLGEKSQMSFNMEETTHETDEAIREARAEGEVQKSVQRAQPKGDTNGSS